MKKRLLLLLLHHRCYTFTVLVWPLVVVMVKKKIERKGPVCRMWCRIR